MNDKYQDKDKTLRGEPLFEDIQILEEGSAAEKPNTRLLKISGTASRGGIINRNGRLYPTEVLNRAVERAQSALRKGKFVGEVDHPEYGGGRLRRLAMKFTKVWMEGADMKFEADILPTASGEILKTLLISGVGIGMSTRGWGSTIRRTSGDKSYLEVQDDFELKGIDAVLDESNPHGTISKYEEGVLGMELTLAELKEKFPKLVEELTAEVRDSLAEEVRQELEADFATKVAEGIQEKKAEFLDEARQEVMESDEIKELKEFKESVSKLVGPQTVVEDKELEEELATIKGQLVEKEEELTEVQKKLDEMIAEKEEADKKAKIAAKVEELVKGHRFEKQLRDRLLVCESVEKVEENFASEVAFIEEITGKETPKGAGRIVEGKDDTNDFDEVQATQRRLAGL